ncbi:ABC transporter permease [Erysipelothrix sp. HDW6C]|uniref:ABC transporter permease n=1 Tax=Erysipelothrix sp. HDW6C TaxID=2714930 RepID=UPI00140B7AD1|nr:ABC transporter permease [Erysipelothrix sp. HDW6C]QIK70597.1 ABC transporter permease [Erysipelothrix sp. HDW6C]
MTQNHKWLTFKTMIKRDLLIQARDKNEFIFRVAMLPLILIFIYGFVLPRIGVVSSEFAANMFPGMVGMSLLLTGIHGTAVPLTMDFNNSREIEDRLQAPVDTKYIALAKMFVGIVEAWIGALIVLPISLLFMSQHLSFTLAGWDFVVLFGILLLASLASASLGLLVGTIVKPMQIAAMFPGFLMPLVFTGAIFFTWNALTPLLPVKMFVLINPLVYINEALRGIMNSNVTSMPFIMSIGGIVFFTVVMSSLGFKRFMKLAKA